VKPDIAVIGAGIAGVAAAHFLLAADPGIDVLIIDRESPLSQTTAKSGENFRGPWPDPGMAALAERSIVLMESFGAPVGLKFSGYDFVSGRAGADRFLPHGAVGGVRRWNDPAAIRASFPYLSASISSVTRLDRAGFVDVHALGSALFRTARRSGARHLVADVTAIEPADSGYRLHCINDADRITLACERLVLAGGPFNGWLAARLGIELPVENFLQRKIVVPDPLRLIPRDMPFTIYADPQRLHWSAGDREAIAGEPEYAWLLEEFPPGLHIKPEGGGRIKMGWAYNRLASEPVREPPGDDGFADIVMRGASCFIPALRSYVEEMPTPVRDFAGYYTRTNENWPLIGPLSLDGVFTIAALSGFGTMVACAAGELLAAWMTGSDLPAYARQFSPARYDNPDQVSAMRSLAADGQL
jgi:glycine/D-amino acid oxidase-like deaminating enzyme